MTSKLRLRRVISIVGAAAALSGASMLTCGVAAASPFEEILNAIGRAASHEGVAPIEVAVSQSRDVLIPAERSAAGSQDEFVRIKNAACLYNKIVGGGGKVYDAFFRDYTDSERQDILDQAYEYSKRPVALVSIICRINSAR